MAAHTPRSAVTKQAARKPTRSTTAPVTPSVTLIGFGNWGTALAFSLFGAGIPIKEIVVRSFSKIKAAQRHRIYRFLDARFTTLDRAALDADVLWICTPDAKIAQTAGEMVAQLQSARQRRPARQVVFHSSGALTSGELAALKAVGAGIASVHPLMSFPNPTAGKALDSRTIPTFPLAGVPFALQGETHACRVARRLVKMLHGAAFTLQEHDKVLYHAFGAFTSPLLVALLTAAAEAGANAGLHKNQVQSLMRPIVTKTIENFFLRGPKRSFSGPLARGDSGTVAWHLSALQEHPALEAIYRNLSLYALDVLPVEQRTTMRQMLLQSVRNAASSKRSAASTA
ncbi:MAG TPA: Rossmann-like and DUF2520 domain-containing protein [Acidobacteriaceae bacterium]|nr:Rossmann-like and DUF2520 domain-containing protein [Acidobacteriaceae bacterium]